MPPQCHLIKDARNPCCTTPVCDFTSTSGQNTGHGNVTPNPAVTPAPGPGLNTPTPGPKPSNHTVQWCFPVELGCTRYTLFSIGIHCSVSVYTVQYRYTLFSIGIHCSVSVYTVQYQYTLFSIGIMSVPIYHSGQIPKYRTFRY